MSQLLMQRGPWDMQLLIDIVEFPTDTPLGAHGVDDISKTGGWAAQNWDFQALIMP